MAAANVALRPATVADEQLLLSWRNDPTAYQYFLNPRPVSLDEHKIWLKAMLARADVDLLVIEVEGDHAGVVRLEYEQSRSAVLSINLAAGFRGRGVGTAAIRAAMERALSRVPVVVAEVIAENIRSRAAFTSAGFELASEGNGLCQYVFHGKFRSQHAG